jgi:hypothetical protein
MVVQHCIRREIRLQARAGGNQFMEGKSKRA